MVGHILAKASLTTHRTEDPGPVTPLSRRGLLFGAAATSLAACSTSTSTSALGSGSAPGSPSAQQPSAAPTGLRFPAGFRWGAATSAYQIEGAVTADGRGASIWDTFSHTPGRIRDGSTGDVSTDHYHRYREDVALMARLGLKSYRFSIAWPRIMPKGTGAVNPKGLDFYARLVDELLAAGIAPVATLYHWDLPQTLQDRGGWVNRDCASWFGDYASAVIGRLGDVVPTWLTINEPKTIVEVAYRYGTMAPGERDDRHAAVVGHHLLLAHGRAVQAARSAGHRVRIAPALNLAPAYPADPDSADDRTAAALADGMENRVYLDPIVKGSYPDDVLKALEASGAGAALQGAIKDGDLAVISSKVDLLAVHYYNPVYVEAGGRYVTKLPTSQASWQQIYPQGLYDVLTRVQRDYGDPVMTITENGRPTADVLRGDTVDDPDRIAFLTDHFAAAHRAIGDGVRLEGYHVWSLLDNFEWAEGYSQRWGLVYVDYATGRRIPKASATWFQQVIARNGL